MLLSEVSGKEIVSCFPLKFASPLNGWNTISRINCEEERIFVWIAFYWSINNICNFHSFLPPPSFMFTTLNAITFICPFGYTKNMKYEASQEERRKKCISLSIASFINDSIGTLLLSFQPIYMQYVYLYTTICTPEKVMRVEETEKEWLSGRNLFAVYQTLRLSGSLNLTSLSCLVHFVSVSFRWVTTGKNERAEVNHRNNHQNCVQS